MNSYQFILVASLTLLIALSSEARPGIGLNSLFAKLDKSNPAPAVAKLTDTDDTVDDALSTKDIKVDKVSGTADEATGSLVGNVKNLDVVSVGEVLDDDPPKAADAEERR